MEKVEKILFWCMILGFAVMFIWMGMMLWGGEAIYSFHSGRLFHVDKIFTIESFMRANFIGIGIWKMAVIFCFGIPWLAMKIVGK